MQVILLEKIHHLGELGAVVKVKDGYARNFLFPRGLAVEASASAVNEVKTKAAAKQHHAAEELAAAQALAQKIQGKTVALKGKAGQGGRLFGSITAKDIAGGLSKLVGEPVDKRKVVLDADIKAFGTYEVEVRVYPQVVAKLKVKVEE